MDNVELIRAGYDAFVRGDVEWLRTFAAPDIEWHPAMGLLLKQTVYRGHDEVADVIWNEIPGVLKGFTVEVLEIEPLDDEKVLAVVNFKGTAESTGMEIEQVFGQVYTVRDGKVHEMRSYSSKAEALAAVDRDEPA